MGNEKIIQELIELLKEVKNHLDEECCQTLMDADSMSAKIEKVLKKILKN